MSSGGSRDTEQQRVFIRQATILRKNLHDWDMKLRDPRGEDWPTMLGRLNAAMVGESPARVVTILIIFLTFDTAFFNTTTESNSYHGPQH